jgi:heptosyltransferase-3
MKYVFRKNLHFIIFCLLDSILKLLPFKKRRFPSEIKKILIVKPDHYGDILLFTAVLPLIKSAYPQANIDMVCGSWATAILGNNPNINKIYYVDHFFLNRTSITKHQKFKKFVSTYFSSLRKIRLEHYDVCLLGRASGLPNMGIFAYFSKSKCIIGHDAIGLGDLCDIVVKYEFNSHEVEHFLELLKPLGIESVNYQNLHSELFYDGKDSSYVDNLIMESHLISHNFIIIHPGAGLKERLLSIDLWIKLVDRLEDDIVICGMDLEKEYCFLLDKHFSGKKKIVDFTKKLSIAQLYLLFAKAKRAFTLDSLSAHIAAMTSTKTTIFYLYEYSKNPEKKLQQIQRAKPLGGSVQLITSFEEFNDLCKELS